MTDTHTDCGRPAARGALSQRAFLGRAASFGAALAEVVPHRTRGALRDIGTATDAGRRGQAPLLGRWVQGRIEQRSIDVMTPLPDLINLSPRRPDLPRQTRRRMSTRT